MLRKRAAPALIAPGPPGKPRLDLVVYHPIYPDLDDETEMLQRFQAAGGRVPLGTVTAVLTPADVEAAQAELTRNEVRAPFSGLVDRVNVEMTPYDLSKGRITFRFK